MRANRFLIVLVALFATGPLFAYTIYLKDGSRLMAKKVYEIRGDTAFITLQNGARTSIAAAEIDETRTLEANDARYGSALLLDDGEFTKLPDDSQPRRKDTLSDVMGDRRPSATSRPPARRPVAPVEESSRLTTGAADYRLLPRSPFSDLEIAAEVQRIFQAQGVGQLSISQGTAPGRLLIDLTTNSEASVFRGLEAAANALLGARDKYPEAGAVFELLLSTAEREPAGQFLLTSSLAQLLADGDVETSTFFIEHVRY